MSELTLFDPMMTLVAQNIKNREATPEESLIIDVAIVNNENQRRSLAWLAREGKTWKNITNPATGEMFTSFEEYGKFRLKLEKTNLHDLANAYRVQSILENSDMSEKEIPLRSAIQLNKLPDSAIPEVYQQAIDRALNEGKKIGAKHVESVVQDYLEKNQTLQKQLESYQTMYSESSRQRDELRDNQAQIIDAKVSEGIAKAVIENQQAIAENKRLAENAQHELERLKREQQKAIADGVRSELNTFDATITHKESVLKGIQGKIDALREVESSLERDVGYLQTHKKAIEKIKDNLSFLTVSFSDAFDTNTIPDEVLTEWQSISYGLSQLNKKMLEFVHDKAPIEIKAVIGELVNEDDGAFA